MVASDERGKFKTGLEAPAEAVQCNLELRRQLASQGN